MTLLLKVLAYGGTIVLAIMGAFVTLWPVDVRTRNGWAIAFAIGGVISFVAALWLSERQDADLEDKLTGGDNYVYVRGDQGDLNHRKDHVRTWICSTGRMYDVKVHPYPFGVDDPDDPRYTSIRFFSENPYVGVGCRWLGLVLPIGKYSFELDSRNGVLHQSLEFIATESGPYRQICDIKRHDRSLATADCPHGAK
jgi:hypothetical protein